MSKRWMDMIEQAGDATTGAALMRLARQAAALHLHEAARRTQGGPPPGRRIGPMPRFDADRPIGTVHKEVDR